MTRSLTIHDSAVHINEAAALLGVNTARIRRLISTQQLAVDGNKVKIASLTQHLHRMLSERSSAKSAKERIANEQAQMIALKRGRLEGSLIPVDDVSVVWDGLINGLRTKLLGIAAKLAPRLATYTDPHEVQEAIAAALEEALADLADGRTVRSAVPEGDEQGTDSTGMASAEAAEASAEDDG